MDVCKWLSCFKDVHAFVTARDFEAEHHYYKY